MVKRMRTTEHQTHMCVLNMSLEKPMHINNYDSVPAFML